MLALFCTALVVLPVGSVVPLLSAPVAVVVAVDPAMV